MNFFVRSNKVPSRPATPDSPIPLKKAKMTDENTACAKDMEWLLMCPKLLGLSNVENAKINLSLGCGSVVSKFDDEFRYVGSSGSANGGSGAGVWSSNGSLIGMNILVKHNPVKFSERTQGQYTHAIGGSSVFIAASAIKLFASKYIPRTSCTYIKKIDLN